jgi:hypothetical protein
VLSNAFDKLAIELAAERVKSRTSYLTGPSNRMSYYHRLSIDKVVVLPVREQ